MIVSLRLAHCITYAALCITLGGCSLSSPKPETRVIAVPSSKPYRYIKPHPTQDKLSDNLLDQIKRHNNVHWQVKQAEKKAAEQK